MNTKAEEWLLCSRKTAIGCCLYEIDSGFEILGAHLNTALKDKLSSHGQGLKIKARNGKAIFCDYIVYPALQSAVIMLSPKAEDNNGNRPSGQAVTMLGKMLAHELKNPLAGIHGAAQLLETVCKTDEDKELTDLIQTEVARIRRLADSMEAFDQDGTKGFKVFNIHTILRKVKLLFQTQAKQNFEIIENYDPSLPDVYGNEDSLMQLVVNLVANAQEAMLQSGMGTKITLKTQYRAGIVKPIGDGRLQKLSIEICVIDDGPGIAPQVRPRIFQPFVTNKANGQGLGLALVSKIVDDHNGLLGVKSKQGQTIFFVLLPINKIK
ncbi:MAG: ATP-binding protein [Robiginitomaculum sp.]